MDTIGGNAGELSEKVRLGAELANVVAANLTAQGKVSYSRGRSFTKDLKDEAVGFMLGLKPSFYAVTGLENTAPIQAFLGENGIKSTVFQNGLIINHEVVRERIVAEFEFARSLGWQDEMPLENWLAMADPHGPSKQQMAIAGFLLGYPRSAIQSFVDDKKAERSLVEIVGPNGGSVYSFVTESELVKSDDVEALIGRSRDVMRAAGLGEVLAKVQPFDMD